MWGYSSNALQAFSSTDLIFFFLSFFKNFSGHFCFYDFSWRRCSHREAQLSLVALQVVCFFSLLFSLEGIETELGLLTAGNVGVWFRLRAGNDDSCSFNERPSKEKVKERQDRYGTCETQRASSTPVQIHVKKEKRKVTLFFSTKWNADAYIPVSYCQESSQWP